MLSHFSSRLSALKGEQKANKFENVQCLVIGKDAKDVSKENALDYVAGYCCGNDVSSRKLQRDPSLAGRVPQWGFSKG